MIEKRVKALKDELDSRILVKYFCSGCFQTRLGLQNHVFINNIEG